MKHTIHLIHDNPPLANFMCGPDDEHEFGDHYLIIDDQRFFLDFMYPRCDKTRRAVANRIIYENCPDAVFDAFTAPWN